MKNCQANALNQERKPRTNKREPHVAPRHYGRNLANTYVHNRVCYPPSSDMRLQLSDDRVLVAEVERRALCPCVGHTGERFGRHR